MPEPVSFGGPHDGFVHYDEEKAICAPRAPTSNCGLAIGTAIFGTPTVVGSVALALLAGGACGHATVSAYECLSKE